MLKDLRAIVPASQANPILNHVKIEGGKVFAANQSHWAELPWDIVSGLPPCCIPYKELAAFFAMVDQNDVVFEMKDDAFVVVKAGRRRATLPVLPVDRFPALTHVSTGRKVSVDADRLALVLHSVSENERVLPQLGGACFRGDTVVATDRQRIVKQEASTGEADVVIPADFCKLLLNRTELPIELTVTDHAATWHGPGGAVITTMLLDGKFPEVDRLWPEDTGWRVWDREEFMAALDTTDLASGSDAVRVEIKDGESRWVSHDNAGKEFVYEGPCEGDDVAFTIARRYLRDACVARPDDKEVRLGINAPTDPVMFGADEIIMPMRK